jgi:hypothetical protein
MWLIARCKSSSSDKPPLKVDAVMLVGVLLSIYDLLTDVLFAWFVNVNRGQGMADWILVVAVCSVAVTVMFNTICVLVQIAGEPEAFRVWFRSNVMLGSMVLFLACLHSQAALILKSKFSGCSIFTAPLTDQFVRRMKLLGLFTNLFEDLPQLFLQLFVIRYYHRPVVLLSYVSISMSSAALLLGGFKRMVEYGLTSNLSPTHSSSSRSVETVKRMSSINDLATAGGVGREGTMPAAKVAPHLQQSMSFGDDGAKSSVNMRSFDVVTV